MRLSSGSVAPSSQHKAKLRERRSHTIPRPSHHSMSDFPALRNTTRNGSSPASAGPRIHSGWPSGSPPRLICTDLECGYSTLAARTRHLLDLPPPRIRRSGLGHRSAGSVPRRTVRESAMRESKTAFSPCMLTPGRYPSATNSSQRHRVARFLLLLPKDRRSVPQLPCQVREALAELSASPELVSCKSSTASFRNIFAIGGRTSLVPALCTLRWRHWSAPKLWTSRSRMPMPDGCQLWLDWH